MAIDMKHIPLNDKLYEVTTLDKYISNPEAYIKNYTAIEIEDYAFPIINSQDSCAGVVINSKSPYSFVQIPEGEDLSKYGASNIIDFTDTKSMNEFAAKKKMIRDIEREILTSPDNIFVPKVDTEADSPSMQVLKQATINKHIDIDKYEPRFGANFNNDKRLFNKHDISIKMLTRLCNNLDIKAELTLSDATSDCPNPMGEPITIELTGGVDNE